MSDGHWLVKDFHVLYRAARQATEAAQRGGLISPELVALQVHLLHLEPAFETCEAERRGGAPTPFVLRGAVPTTAKQAARFRDASGLTDVRAPRLTEAEREAGEGGQEP